MPALPAVPYCVEMAVHFTNDTRPGVNLWHVRYTGTAPDGTALTALDTALSTAWGSIYRAYAGDWLTLNDVTYTDLASSGGARVIIPYGGSGLLSGNALPVSSAVVVSEQNSLRYRGGHPRIYLPAGLQADTTDGYLWATGLLDNLQIGTDLLVAAIPVGPVSGCTFAALTTVSRTSGGATRVPPITSDVLALAFQERICSQRRRLGKLSGYVG